ncbi:unnamed protein product [Soboliphyme baturini]|uniref:Uncharacterized protein n=1 Tax=Soboliphyme baturini TaxID=241478 RepID=A0A183IN94_9BILA|nr:unnamed protein product [Soboliphyme baturini]
MLSSSYSEAKTRTGERQRQRSEQRILAYQNKTRFVSDCAAPNTCTTASARCDGSTECSQAWLKPSASAMYTTGDVGKGRLPEEQLWLLESGATARFSPRLTHRVDGDSGDEYGDSDDDCDSALIA